MRIVVAPQEFKGSLTAIEAARAIGLGMRRAFAGAEVIESPMSDGGPGLVDALVAARGGERIDTDVHDPLMRPVRATWAILRDGQPLTAAIEMAAASGLVLLREEERDPLVATTYGSGELMRAALDRGCTKMIVGVGGSATVDGGAGALQALGVRLLDWGGHDLAPGGGPLAGLGRIDLSVRDARLAGAEVVVASDVTNRLCGRAGAAAMFGPQKGASAEDVRTLDSALHHFAVIARRDCGIEVLDLRGGGAAGGLAAGLAAGAGATIQPGFTIVAEAVGLDAQIAAADLVVTGEGRLDAQTAYGKTADGVARMARTHGKRVVMVAGSIERGYDEAAGPFDVVETVLQPGMSAENAMRDAAKLVANAAERAGRRAAAE